MIWVLYSICGLNVGAHTFDTIAAYHGEHSSRKQCYEYLLKYPASTGPDCQAEDRMFFCRKEIKGHQR